MASLLADEDSKPNDATTQPRSMYSVDDKALLVVDLGSRLCNRPQTPPTPVFT